MNLFLRLSLLGLILQGCGKGLPDADPSNKSTLSTSAYGQLMDASDADLIEKAKSSNLGACKIKNVGKQNRGCVSDDSFALLIDDKNLYWPTMSYDLKDSPACLSAMGGFARQALKEGFCFQNAADLAQLDDESYTRRGLAKDLGDCQVINLGRATGCSYDESYVIFLKRRKIYYPTLTIEPSASSQCRSQIGPLTRQAYKNNLCGNF